MTQAMIDAINRLIAPLHKRVVNMIARAVVNLINDSTDGQTVQVEILDGETKADFERPQSYGFTSVPLPGADGVAAFIGGKRDNGVLLVVDDRRYRLKNLSGGEVAMYDHTGSKIVLKANGDIEVTPSSGVAKFVGDVNVSGALAVTGNATVGATLTATTDVVGGGISLKNHTHAHGTYAAPQDAGNVTGSSGAPQ